MKFPFPIYRGFTLVELLSVTMGARTMPSPTGMRSGFVPKLLQVRTMESDLTSSHSDSHDFVGPGTLTVTMPAITLTIAAASSLAPILPMLVAVWNRDHKIAIRPTFGASGTLLRQIVAGAPIDIFLSAGDKEVNELIGLSAVRPSTRTAFAENRLVLAQATSARIRLKGWADLLELPARFRIALGKPETVPAGRYAREALRKRGMYEALQRQKRLVFTGTVRQAADAAASGNVDAALVFATDIRADKRLRTVVTAVAGTDHMPIRYVAIVTKQARSEAEAASFVRFLRSKPARRVLRVAGFVVLD